MPKYPLLKAKVIVKVLEKFGFKVVRVKGSHIQMKHLETWKFTTVPNHSSKAVDPFLLKLILQQTWITLEEFKKFL